MYRSSNSSTKLFERPIALPRHHALDLLDKLGNIYLTRGEQEFVTHCKNIKIALYSCTSKNKLSNKSSKVDVTYDGIPTIFNNSIPFIRRVILREIDGNTILPVLTSILNGSRLLSIGTFKKEDIESIEGPLKIEKVRKFDDKYYSSFLRSLGMPRRGYTAPKWTKFHFTTKMGPQGHALWTSISDFVSISKEMKDDIRVLGGEDLSTKMDILERCLSMEEGRNLFSSIGIGLNQGQTRKISVTNNSREDKVRVVAIFDYWSQTSLRPLHKFTFNLLRKINQDCTFNQGSFKSKLENLEGPFYSFDLSSATDRFPIEIQEELLAKMFGKQYASSWRRLMIGHPFYNRNIKRDDIYYSVGNPMGAYSSWSSFALAHHFIVYVACIESYMEHRDLDKIPYVLLGDDIVIADHKIASAYKRIVQEDLGIDISWAKSLESDDSFEFAKRIFINKSECSSLPIQGIKELSTSNSQIVNLFLESRTKGYEINGSSVAPVVTSWLESHRNIRDKRSLERLERELYIIEQGILFLQNSISAEFFVSEVVRLYGRTVFPGIDLEESGKHILSMIFVEMFADSNPLNNMDKTSTRDSGPLGLLPELCLINITGLSPKVTGDGVFWEHLIQYSIPFLTCYGQIEEDYIAALKAARDNDTIHAGLWEGALRRISIPYSDKVFVTRSSKLVPKIATSLGFRIRDKLDQFTFIND